MVGAQQGAGEFSPALFWKSGKNALILALILSIFVLNFPFKF